MFPRINYFRAVFLTTVQRQRHHGIKILSGVLWEITQLSLCASLLLVDRVPSLGKDLMTT